jgi:hypothetical protein
LYIEKQDWVLLETKYFIYRNRMEGREEPGGKYKNTHTRKQT